MDDVLDTLKDWSRRLPVGWYGQPHIKNAIAEIERLRRELAEAQQPRTVAELEAAILKPR